MADYSTIVAATDLSQPSLPVLDHAAALADKLGAALIVTFVVDDRLPPIVLAQSSEPLDTLLERHREHAARELDETLAKCLPGRTVEAVVRIGTVHEQIVALARERSAGLLVVGMHGHGFLGHALTGNTAERVLHQAPCPVVVVAETN